MATLCLMPPLHCSLEDALRQQAAELERRGRDWAAREAALSSGHTRSHGASAAAHAELGVAQDALDAAAKRVRALEGDNAELRKQKAQVAADKRMLEELLADGDAERRWAERVGGRRGGGAGLGGAGVTAPSARLADVPPAGGAGCG